MAQYWHDTELSSCTSHDHDLTSRNDPGRLIAMLSRAWGRGLHAMKNHTFRRNYLDNRNQKLDVIPQKKRIKRTIAWHITLRCSCNNASTTLLVKLRTAVAFAAILCRSHCIPTIWAHGNTDLRGHPGLRSRRSTEHTCGSVYVAASTRPRWDDIGGIDVQGPPAATFLGRIPSAVGLTITGRYDRSSCAVVR